MGQEHLRKIILQWEKVQEAAAYEVCHNCEIEDLTGLRSEDCIGDVLDIPIGRAGTCGHGPCMVMPAAPIGYNKFHLRVKVGGEWSLWSRHRNFNVQEPGRVEHEEL